MPVDTHKLDCDVLIAGGGPAGVPCALAAARSGVKVILCHDRPVLGGNASSEVRMHIVGANGTGSFDRGRELETEAREGGIIEEIRLEACVRNPQRSASMFDLILYDMCRAEPNLSVLLNTSVVAAEMAIGAIDRIESVIAERPSTQDRFRVSAKVFVDCTGDGRLGVEAGAAFMEGRESREQFGESLARETADNSRLGSTILLQARKHDRPMPFSAPSWVRQFSREDLKLRLYAFPGEETPTHEYGFWWAEWGGTLDTVKDNEMIRDELLAITLGIWDHIKNGPIGEAADCNSFDAANWALDWVGFLPGKRESRRFIGQHILTEQDVMQSREFPDAIAYGGWSLDLHPPEGIDAPEQAPCTQHHVPWLYDIPLRCCVARDVCNLMFAGRNISATHVAFSSTRVMATCAVIGQGVGTAAAYAASRACEPMLLWESSEHMSWIQQRLLRDDAYLIGHRNSERSDLARRARITASSYQSGGEATNVVTGQTRAVHGARGAPSGRNYFGSHRWMSDPEQGLPAWIQLEWDSPEKIDEIQLAFDTGLHRHLTLSQHNGYTTRMCWGVPQPETVLDYQVAVRTEQGWKALANITGNYQRVRRHRLAPTVKAFAIRITITATGGLDHARVCELRVQRAE
ncbi:MAG: FAD-dependent oxidoreductase [Planctomycetaceae bacterium]|nr:FAD-dependent oxidoreductase [Planctomycetales bacterium]MCB9923129.1 FAD-dependent oxidoreductase [Planctomycetaceae bacterium]